MKDHQGIGRTPPDCSYTGGDRDVWVCRSGNPLLNPNLDIDNLAARVINACRNAIGIGLPWLCVDEDLLEHLVPYRSLPATTLSSPAGLSA